MDKWIKKQTKESWSEYDKRMNKEDRTWLHIYDRETKEQSKEWRHSGSSRPKKFRTQKSAKKVMFVKVRFLTKTKMAFCWRTTYPRTTVSLGSIMLTSWTPWKVAQGDPFSAWQCPLRLQNWSSWVSNWFTISATHVTWPLRTISCSQTWRSTWRAIVLRTFPTFSILLRGPTKSRKSTTTLLLNSSTNNLPVRFVLCSTSIITYFIRCQSVNRALHYTGVLTWTACLWTCIF